MIKVLRFPGLSFSFNKISNFDDIFFVFWAHLVFFSIIRTEKRQLYGLRLLFKFIYLVYIVIYKRIDLTSAPKYISLNIMLDFF
jgi:hypothetical protein